MKLSKAQRKKHEEAESLLSLSRKLIPKEREFCLNHWLPGATGDTGKHGVFFTPESIAIGSSFMFPDHGKTIDLCAGIGRLAYHCWLSSQWGNPQDIELTCVEFNSTYVDVGKRILPEAEWIRADISDYAAQFNEDEEPFSSAFSNPPYGNVPTLKEWNGYKGPAHLVTAAIMAQLTSQGCGWLIIPESDIEQSFNHNNQENSIHYKRWRKHHPHLHLNHASVDLSYAKDEWIGAKPNVTLAYLEKDIIVDDTEEREELQLISE